MKKSFVLSAATLLLALVVAAPGRVSAADKEAPAECCFTRDGARQLCRVTPGEEETCESILTYLNSPGTSGKSYCAGNKLRGGWKAADCAADESGKDKGQD